MSQTVEDKTVELMDRAAGAIESFSVKLAALAETYGPDVTDAVLWVARIDALNYLGVSFVLLIIGSIVLFFTTRFKLIDWAKKHSYVSDGASYALIAVPIIGYLTLFTIAIARLLNPWPWVGIIEPQLWIAKRLLGF